MILHSVYFSIDKGILQLVTNMYCILYLLSGDIMFLNHVYFFPFCMGGGVGGEGGGVGRGEGRGGVGGRWAVSVSMGTCFRFKTTTTVGTTKKYIQANKSNLASGAGGG